MLATHDPSLPATPTLHNAQYRTLCLVFAAHTCSRLRQCVVRSATFAHVEVCDVSGPADRGPLVAYAHMVWACQHVTDGSQASRAPQDAGRGEDLHIECRYDTVTALCPISWRVA